MKIFAVAAIVLALMLAQGCTSNDRDSAGLKRLPANPSEQAAPVPAPHGGQPGVYTNPESNGGSSLAAAAPYEASGGAPAPQNVNPGPFLGASTPTGSNPASSAANPSTLTRSADGTMSGPNDLPPATTGWGTVPANYAKPAPAAMPGLPKKKTATPQ